MKRIGSSLRVSYPIHSNKPHQKKTARVARNPYLHTTRLYICFITDTYGSMSEQYPLLSDDLSDEERFSPHFRRRSRDRVRNQMKGAAAIITRWPEHWTTLLNYWWIGVGMIALSTYIVYSCLLSLAMFESTNKFHANHVDIKTEKITPKSIPPKVYMHIFVDDKQEIDLNNYLPYIKIVANKYEHFSYELIIIANDTSVDTKMYSDKENNEKALNMLWTDDIIYKKILTSNSNLDVKYITLSKYLYDSPIKKYWKTLPQQFIKFLVRAVSIWEKGGIAFDPIVLTPQSPHSIYIDKLYNILKKYKLKREKSKTRLKSPKQNTPSKRDNRYKLRPNNIRDVIYALEGGDTTISYQEPLVEAETSDNITATGRKLLSINDTREKDKMTSIKLSETQDKEFGDGTQHRKDMLQKETAKEKKLNNSSKLNLLPFFLDYLFQNNHTKSFVETTANTDVQSDSQTKIGNKSIFMRDFWTGTTDKIVYRPMIISAKGIFSKPNNETKLVDTIKTDAQNLFEVTVDLKGNVIATDTACHAFVGNIFSNAVHHDRSESVTDFIIKELSIFCNGLLASCKGIDVILL